MKSIKLTIGIINIDEWNIDWNNKSEVKKELKNLSDDVQFALFKLGIGMGNIKIESEFEDLSK